MEWYQHYKNKRVLVTGHTGFKGSWLALWLLELGAHVSGVALPPLSEADNFVVTGLESKLDHHILDIRDYEKLKALFDRVRPEIVFHLAAQPLVRESYNDPKATFDINIGGTVNVLECCRQTDSVRSIINVTSDKCYENSEWVWGYRENDRVGGHDPYSSSKGCSELVSDAFRRSFFSQDLSCKALATVRAGNVIGGGDWQKDRIIPDCLRAIMANQPITVRNPLAVRPWQHVLEPLSGYLLLAEKLCTDPEKFSGAWNFGPPAESILPVKEIVSKLTQRFERADWLDVHDASQPHEARLLALDISKARHGLRWLPTMNIDQALDFIVQWQNAYLNKQDMLNLCLTQIRTFSRIARQAYEDIT